MSVIDGAHRLRAARVRGHGVIAVRFFDGSEQDAALLAVALNVAQGRPLSLAERTAAAERTFLSHPHWSDRAVAAVVGLSRSKVAQVRRDTAEGGDSACFRVGRDGRIRPLNAARGRELASELIRMNPDASLRQIAKRAGIAPATVADVRSRMRRGEDPVPPKLRPLMAENGTTQSQPAQQFDRLPAERRNRAAQQGGLPGETRSAPSSAVLKKIVHSLYRDPSLRFSESGRSMLRLFEMCGLIAEDRSWLTAHAPAHCRELITHLADGYAEAWRQLAEELRREDNAQELQMS
ncbi:hypothetical protein [Streptomyces sp. ML-6]|uniref:hypothetical protein n=1 Tax=Streptomyces sp. ML-6 TaxID=2982693 RepID=UPI0024BF3E0B|nr:hypothetical protein [Streptomyces sp. ML-6]MDK0517989.1 hypothetical protein [Streptomyces sp. ML-6]